MYLTIVIAKCLNALLKFYVYIIHIILYVQFIYTTKNLNHKQIRLFINVNKYVS